MKRSPVSFVLPTDRQVVFGLLAILATLLAVAFAAGYAVAGPRAPASAYIASDTGAERNTDSVRLLVVKNPRHDSTRVVVWCRKDSRTMTAATVPARGQVTFEMASDRPLRAGDCEIAR